jgi:Transposase DDE domain
MLRFLFPRQVCEACPLFARCVQSKTESRTLTSRYHEALLQKARAKQATPEFRESYRKRAAIERKIADLVGHGLRRARYLGRVKVRLQNHWIAAVVNLRRLFRLFKGDTGQMCQALTRLASA